MNNYPCYLDASYCPTRRDHGVSLWVVILLLLLNGMLSVALLAEPIDQEESVELVSIVTSPEAGHGSYCLIGEAEYFLGRDLQPHSLDTYAELERWCTLRSGIVRWRP